MKLVRKKVLGYSMIPKINEMPPKIICDTEDYFKQLENLGFTLIDMDEETPKEPIKENETSKFVVSEPVNISIEGGIELDFPKDTSVTFVVENENAKSLETKTKEIKKSENKQESKSNKNNKKNKAK